eukprot:scaffold26033_cov104-Isochrysis_galbana.AAC.2
MTLLIAPTPLTTRQVVVTALVCITRLELAGFLLYRVLKRGKDSRFDQVREKCCVFLAFWVWQMFWVFFVSASVIYINGAGYLADDALTAYDWVGWFVFAFGFIVQVWSDMDKNSFRSDRANAKKVCDRGLWSWSRHPNFCGEVLMWIGIYVAGVPVFLASPAGWATIVSPLFTFGVLTLFTGIPQAEGVNSKRWFDGGASQQQYELYFETTAPFWLFPPQLYSKFPKPFKCLLCCELPMYAFHQPELSSFKPDAGPPSEDEEMER